MVFFDTCIWIELCCTTVPTTPTQQAQAQKASQVLADSLQSGEKIVTCREQLLEIISAIQKVKMREYNKACKQAALPGISKLKDYKTTADFTNAQNLCTQAISDIRNLADEANLGSYNVDDVLSNIHLVDINDYLYYQYCMREGISFYTLDQDFLNLPSSPNIHVV